MTYLLTDKARAMTYSQWRKIGGCGISNYSTAWISSALKTPPSAWNNLTLGQLSDAFIVADRELARFALEHLRLSDMAIPEQRTV